MAQPKEMARRNREDNESNPFLKLPSVAHEIMTEHMNAKTVDSFRGTSTILQDSLKGFNAMQKALKRTCLDAVKNPSSNWAIEESNDVCGQTFTDNRLNLKCRNDSDVCARVITAEDLEDFPDFNHIVIPSGTVMIGPYTFSGLDIVRVTIPNTLTNIGSNAFNGCNFLTDIQLPDSVEIIQTGAFEGCGQLKKLIMPSNIRHLGIGAFLACTNLELVFQNLSPRLPHESLAKAFYPPFMGANGGPRRITFRVDLKKGPFQIPYNTLLRNMPNIQDIEIVIEALE